ncbi:MULTISPECIES: helix-turn-helix domain-containing protein [Nocardiopsidaceae]|uniref:Helix-turn-helix transcriptional regulator n=2 Tax=Nocardiopsidaceae TaxID=83676 RepID=A0ABY6YN69_9ACTN|nr:helix-turn-helix transcriptional regulator [Streptomonospora nanhaiensis]MEE2048275.1 helix-turn-helix transcriptional regulator [Nocardiopsis tropica]WAE73817.1 helix-turn-helix transcriptional regulator [Streptomonospora nanhaiensis]
MSGYRRWRDSGHLEKAVESSGGQEQFEEEVTRLRDRARAWRLVEMRKHRELSQSQVAQRMGVSVARVSQIESGDLSTRDVLDRYVTALGGTLLIIADFGDEQMKVG